jgi:hypothetical protein
MEMPNGAKIQVIKQIPYVYIDKPYWNAEKKRGEHKRNYVGKLVDDEFIPNGKYLLSIHSKSKTTTRRSQPPAAVCQRKFYGATYLLNQIGFKLGIHADLKTCFPQSYQQIESICYYLILESGQSMYRFRKWGLTHVHPFTDVLTSQRISELLGNIKETGKMEFFKRQAARRAETEYLAFDTTSISSYSELIKQAKYGKNKEGDSLPQINLGLLYGEKSKLPVYYRKLAGNTADVVIVRNLLKDISFLELEKLSFVMDRGFYSERNINELMKHHHKFLIGTRCSLKLIRQHLEKVQGEKFTDWKNYHEDIGLYAQTFSTHWDYEERKPRSGEIVTGKRRVYIHLYFNPQRCTDEQLSFTHKLTRLQAELLSNHRVPGHEKEYERYFICHETPKRGMTVTANEEAIYAKKKDFGYFALLSNGIKDPVEAIHIYRNKDLIEKSFGNLKERLDMRRMSIASEENFEGKLFIQFVALMYLSYIKKQMDEKQLFKNFTMQTLLDELDIIEQYQQTGHDSHLSEMTTKQVALYLAMDVGIPS